MICRAGANPRPTDLGPGADQRGGIPGPGRYVWSMAYPDELLVEGERVVLHRHPHWKKIILPVLALLLVVGLGSYVAALIAAQAWAGWGWPRPSSGAVSSLPSGFSAFSPMCSRPGPYWSRT